MMTNSLENSYFNWMCGFVYDTTYTGVLSYIKLLKHLHYTDFQVLIPHDQNRAEDGIDLRYRFGRECGYDDALIASELDNKPCSVLEMMLALAIRCEETIMTDNAEGDRTGQWFWNMVLSLGLSSMTDENYDHQLVKNVLTIFLNRMYQPDGQGGLFTYPDCPYDLSEIEIWTQMNWYLGDYISRLEV